MKRVYVFMLVAMMAFMTCACGKSDNQSDGKSEAGRMVQSSETSSVRRADRV